MGIDLWVDRGRIQEFFPGGGGAHFNKGNLHLWGEYSRQTYIYISSYYFIKTAFLLNRFISTQGENTGCHPFLLEILYLSLGVQYGLCVQHVLLKAQAHIVYLPFLTPHLTIVISLTYSHGSSSFFVAS